MDKRTAKRLWNLYVKVGVAYTAASTLRDVMSTLGYSVEGDDQFIPGLEYFNKHPLITSMCYIPGALLWPVDAVNIVHRVVTGKNLGIYRALTNTMEAKKEDK